MRVVPVGGRGEMHVVWGAVLTAEGAQYIEKLEAEVERLREERDRILELLRDAKPHVAHNGLRVRIWAALEAAQENEPLAPASGEFAPRSHDRSAGEAGEA